MLYLNYKLLADKDKKDILTKLYIKQKMSLGDIATECNTYSNQIRRDAKKFSIPMRDKSEAQKNALSTGKHKHPTKGTQRAESTKDKIGVGVMDSWSNLSEADLNRRKEKSRINWENLTQDDRDNILKSANMAARESSKTGSKLEKFILTQLLKDGYRVDFHKEQMLSNTKLQVDLFLPTINLAIEIDGPSHFSPIWGQDALAKNQKYDEKKNGLLIGKGLSLIRIKQTKDFSKTRANIIYTKLLNLLINKTYTNNSITEIED